MKRKFYIDTPASEYGVGEDFPLYANTSVTAMPDGFERYWFEVDLPDHLCRPRTKGKLEVTQQTAT